MTVNRVTGNMLDGHLRTELALERGESYLDVTYVELSPEEERLVLATLDPLGATVEITDRRRSVTPVTVA